MPSPIILTIAAGPNVGAAVPKKFADSGYKVTLAARSLSEGIQSNEHLYVKADLSNPDTVSQIFH
jgi:NAD(P)-dependent dehydrogenase (short-subunit alcohol dehydrogenase family)